MEICSRDHCLGCAACANICPREAIDMTADDHGVLLPRIDPERCVDCGLCAKVCPVLHPVELHPEGECLAAWSCSAELRQTAASAGIISQLSKAVLDLGGVVFGTRYENKRLVFDHIEDPAEITKFQGSKYVHAYVGNAYRQVRDLLKAGRLVLFPGTPCQIAGLRCFLNREYENLLTVDLLCHGVTTNQYLNEYLLHKGIDHYDSVLFRGMHGQRLAVFRDGKLLRLEEKLLSPFYMAYVRGLIHRENCYSCPFASTNRCADLTAGDFWGLKRHAVSADLSGIPFPSLVLVNTEKGRHFLEQANITWESRPLVEAMSRNGQLNRPCVRHSDRDKFLKHYQKEKFHTALMKSGFLREYWKQAMPLYAKRLFDSVKSCFFAQ